MASNTNITEFRRKIRKDNAGRDRKRKLRLHGTTPVFPIHQPAPQEEAPSGDES